MRLGISNWAVFLHRKSCLGRCPMHRYSRFPVAGLRPKAELKCKLIAGLQITEFGQWRPQTIRLRYMLRRVGFHLLLRVLAVADTSVQTPYQPVSFIITRAPDHTQSA